MIYALPLSKKKYHKKYEKITNNNNNKISHPWGENKSNGELEMSFQTHETKSNLAPNALK